MSPRPDPTQHTVADARRWAQEMQRWLRPGYVFTEELFEGILHDPSGSHLAMVTVRAWIEERRAELRTRYVLTEGQAEALEQFLAGEGPRPAFVHGPVVGGFLTSEERTQLSKTAAQLATEGPKEDPEEPGRYVKPRGHFALPGAEGFEPGPR